MRKFIAYSFAVFAALYVVAFCTRCTPSHQGVVLDVAGHSLALRDCFEKGKDAGSRAVAMQCADDVDRRFMDGGR